MIDPKTLSAGVIVRHSSGARYMLKTRKEDDSGWWMTDGSGLVDTAWESGDWQVLPGQVIDTSKPLDLDSLRDVLTRIGFRLGLIEEAITTNHQEVILAVSNVQDTINADIATLTQALSDFAAEWQQVSQRLAMEAPQIDTSKLDELAQQAQAMDTAWKAQLAEPATGTATSSSTSDPTSSTLATTGAADTAATGAATGSATGVDTGSATSTPDPASNSAQTGSSSAGDTTTAGGTSAAATDTTTAPGTTAAE